MAKTLTAADLTAIARTIQPVIEKTVGELIDEKVPTMIKQEVKPLINEAIEELAVTTNNAIAQEIAMLRSEMATKDDIETIREEMVTKYDLRDAVADIKDEIHPILRSHEQRLTKLEERVS